MDCLHRGISSLHQRYIDTFLACRRSQTSFFVKGAQRIDCVAYGRLAMAQLEHYTIPDRIGKIA